MRYVNSFLFLVALCSTSCQSTGNNIRKFLSENFKSDSGNLYLKDYNKQPWDKVYIIKPYADLNKANTDIVKEVSKIRRTGIETRDDIAVLAFFNEGALTDIAEVPVNKPDFALLEKKSSNGIICFLRKDACFTYDKKDNCYYVHLNLPGSSKIKQ